MENRRGVAQVIATDKRAAAIAVIANVLNTAVFEEKRIFRASGLHGTAPMRVKKDFHVVKLWDE
jgi:hypothetical protein